MNGEEIYRSPQMTKVLLSISGGAGMFPAAFGAAYRLKAEILKEHPPGDGWVVEYGGVSSGCLVALCLAADKKIGFIEAPYDPAGDQIYIPFGKCFDTWWKTPLTYLYPALRKFLYSLITDAVFKRVNNRLHIGISVLTWRGLRFKVISSFTSREDLVEAIIASCSLFPLSWTPFRVYRGQLCADGGYMYNEVILPNYVTYAAKYTHLGNHLTIVDWYPSPCLQKSQRLVSTAWHATQQHLLDHSLQKYRVFPIPCVPIWRRLLRWIGTRVMFIYLLYHRLHKVKFVYTLLQKLQKWFTLQPAYVDRFTRELWMDSLFSV